MKRTNYLDISNIILQVKFIKSSNNIFVCTPDSLMEVLKNLDGYHNKGIVFIKQFDPAKNTFQRVSKKQIRAFCNWDTETDIYLNTHYYFK